MRDKQPSFGPQPNRRGIDEDEEPNQEILLSGKMSREASEGIIEDEDRVSTGHLLFFW